MACPGAKRVLLLGLLRMLMLIGTSISPVIAETSSTPLVTRAATPIAINTFNTSAPAVTASVNVVAPPNTVLNVTMLTNASLSFLGFFSTGTSLFNASFPVEAQNTTVPPLPTHNTSIASLIPSNASETINQDGSDSLLIPDPSWGAAILVNASALESAQLVASNITQTSSTTVFTTVYNTTTVSQRHAMILQNDIAACNQR